MEGSHAPRILTGSAGIMVWGPYAELEKGEYLVVYRFRLSADPEPESTVFLDVAHNACTRAGVRLGAGQLTAGQWLEVAVPVSLPEKKKLEYRFWPGGNSTALDRIYVFKITPRSAEPGESSAPAETLPAGEPVEGRADVVTSPHTDDRGMIDISGLKPGARVRCPYTGKDFRTP